MHDLAPLLVDVLVTLSAASHGQGRIHMHVMAGEVQTDQQLEYHAPSRFCRRQKYEQASRCATISDHIQYCSELRGLLPFARRVSVQGI